MNGQRIEIERIEGYGVADKHAREQGRSLYEEAYSDFYLIPTTPEAEDFLRLCAVHDAVTLIIARRIA